MNPCQWGLRKNYENNGVQNPRVVVHTQQQQQLHKFDVGPTTQIQQKGQGILILTYCHTMESILVRGHQDSFFILMKMLTGHNRHQGIWPRQVYENPPLPSPPPPS